jgi:hypothetical protein
MSLLDLLAQQVAAKTPQGAVPPQRPAMPTPMQDMTRVAPPSPPPQPTIGAPTALAPVPAHPHWWGRLILGQGEFAPGTPLGMLSDVAPPTMALRAGADFGRAANAGSGVGMAMAALPLIPGEGEAAKGVEGLVHDIAPPAKSELETLLAQQAQRERGNLFPKPTSALERITPEENQSLYELFAKKGVRPKPLPNY